MEWIENLSLDTLNAMYWATMSGSWYSKKAARVEGDALHEVWAVNLLAQSSWNLTAQNGLCTLTTTFWNCCMRQRMTFEQYGYQYLREHGVPTDKQDEIMDIVIIGGAGAILADMMDVHIDACPAVFLLLYRTVLRSVVGQWLDDNRLSAPYRRNFMEDQMATVIKSCTCSSRFQDSVYGLGMRVMNITKESQFRCTVCGSMHGIKSSAVTVKK